MVVLERKVTRDIYFGDFSGPYWPDFRKLEHFFWIPLATDGRAKAAMTIGDWG